MKIFKIIRKVVKWYLISDLFFWAFIGLKELWREDIENDGYYGLIKLSKEAFYTWKYDKYVKLNKEEEP